jgi:flagellar biosynthesis/type III secretory pathway protein FliH
LKNKVAVASILVAVILASALVWAYQQTNAQTNYNEGYDTGMKEGLASGNATGYQAGYTAGYQNGAAVHDPINPEAKTVRFNSTELQNFESIISRLTVYNVDPNFTGNRKLEWISMRNS